MTLDLQNNVVIRSLGLDERAIQVLCGTGSDEPQPKPEHSLILVAEVNGHLVGTISAERVWSVSNFSVDLHFRGRGLAEEMARTIAAMNDEGLSQMLCTTNRHVQLLAHRMGFVPVKGVLFRR